MSYRKAQDILPEEVIRLIQKYVDGENIYIPRIENNRKEWGSTTSAKKDIQTRNDNIFYDYKQGFSVSGLSEKYFLSEKSIQRILYESKKAV